MGLDDIIDSGKEDAKESKVNELAEELGVEDKEDLEKLNNQMKTLSEIVISLDKEVEELREEVSALRSGVIQALDNPKEGEKEQDEDDSAWEV